VRRAAILLQSDHTSIDQVAHNTGYASRSGFLRNALVTRDIDILPHDQLGNCPRGVTVYIAKSSSTRESRLDARTLAITRGRTIVDVVDNWVGRLTFNPCARRRSFLPFSNPTAAPERRQTVKRLRSA